LVSLVLLIKKLPHEKRRIISDRLLYFYLGRVTPRKGSAAFAPPHPSHTTPTTSIPNGSFKTIHENIAIIGFKHLFIRKKNGLTFL